MQYLTKQAQVFVVEDSDPDVFLLQEALRAHHVQAQIQRCLDGEEAIRTLSQIVESRLPHIVIIDLNLPKITGLEILKHVRSLKLFDRVPVVILTSSQSLVDRALAKQLGADAYIAKPSTLPDFLSTVGSGIRTLLERPATQVRARHRRTLARSRSFPTGQRARARMSF